MKKTGLAAILTAGVMLVTAGCGPLKAGKTAIEVGDVKVTMNDLSIFLNEGDGFESTKDQYVKMMEETIKYGELAKEMGIELTDEDKKNILQSKANFAKQGGGLEAYKKYLKKIGSSMEFLDTLFTDSLYQSKITEQIEGEIGDAEPTDDEIKQYFLDNYYRAKHVLVNKEKEDEAADATEDAPEATESNEPTAEPTPVTEEDGKKGSDLADLILEKANNGEDFDKLIEKYNQDPGMASNEDGYIFTEGSMVSEFEDCVKSLEPGKFGICESTYGYHIIQRLPLDEEQKKFKDWLEENKEAVKNKIHEQKIKDRLNELCEEHNITSSVNQDAVDAFTEDMLVKPDSK